MTTRSRKLTGSAGAVLGYFEELRAQALESYYSPVSRNGDDPDNEIVFDELWGHGPELLGITSLTRGQFTDLANGEWDGKKLTRAGNRKVRDPKTGVERMERVRTTAIDVVVAAPKSVMEALIAIDDPELRAAVVDAWKASVKAGFESMEAHAAVARVPVQKPSERGPRIIEHGPNAGQESKMQGSQTKRVPASLIAIPVIQFSARPTDETIARGSPPDPHLHAHVVIMGVCIVVDDDGRVHTYTPDEQGIRATAQEREAVVMGEFARLLEEIGFRLVYTTDKRGTTTWEIAGSNPEIRRFLSTNGEMAHRLRREFEERNGRPPTDAELTTLRDIHRHRKDADAKQVDQYGAWNRWKTDLTRAKLRLTIPTIRPIERAPREKREDELRGRLLGPTGLTRDDSVFTRDDVRATIARCAVGLGFTPEDLARIEDAVVMSAVPVAEARDSRVDTFTTRTMLNAELAIAHDIERRAHATAPAPRASAVRRAITHSPVDLDDEQRTAVERMCSSRAWVMLEGHAGTGKTSTLKAVVDAYRDTPAVGRAAADEIIVLSTAAATAERTARPLNADRSGSIDSFVAAMRHGAWKRPVQETIVVRDARGQLVERTITRYETWAPTERTLIIVDEAAMVDTLRTAELLAWAGDAKIILVGDPKQLTPIGPGGWYAEAADNHGVFELTRVYRQKGPVAEPFRKVREGAAKQALDALKDQGRVHVAEDRSHAVQRAVEMYREHRDAGRAEDDVVLIAEGSNHEIDTLNRLVQRERRESEEIGGSGIEVRATATNRRWTLHDSDLIIFLERYDRDRDKSPKDKRQRKVDNGETGVIVAVDTENNRVVIAMDRGDVITVDLDDEARTQPVGLRYAVHIAKYQGHEADVGIVLPGTSRITSQNSSYSQLTRAKLEAHVIVDYETHGLDPIDRLADAWSQPETKQTAMSQLDRDDATRYRRAYEAAKETSRWSPWRRKTTRGDNRDATRFPPSWIDDPMKAAREDRENVVAKHQAQPDSEQPDDDDAAGAGKAEEDERDATQSPARWIDDPMSAAREDRERVVAKHQAQPDSEQPDDDDVTGAGEVEEPGASTASDITSWIDDPMRAAREELDAVIAGLGSVDRSAPTADDDGPGMREDDEDERTAARARAAEDDTQRERRPTEAERKAKTVPDDMTDDERRREEERERERGLELQRDYQKRREQGRHEATIQFREWLESFPKQEMWLRGVAEEAVDEATPEHPVPQSRAAARNEQREIAARALREAWEDDLHRPVFVTGWDGSHDGIPYHHYFGTGEAPDIPGFLLDDYLRWARVQPENSWRALVDWEAVAHDLLYTEPEPMRVLLATAQMRDLRGVDRSDLFNLAAERLLRNHDVEPSAREAAEAGGDALKQWWDEHLHTRDTFTFTVIPDVDTSSADWDRIAERLLRHERTPLRSSPVPPFKEWWAENIENPRSSMDTPGTVSVDTSDADGDRSAEPLVRDEHTPTPVAADSAAHTDGEDREHPQRPERAVPHPEHDIRPEDIPFGWPPDPPPPPRDADPRFDDTTRAVYRVLLTDYHLDADAWRAVEYACTWWDEGEPWPTRYHDADTLRKHAADALEEWWTGLADTARDNDDAARLDILAGHDTEHVDWHLIAEHVLERDSQGDLRDWAHEIPFDPFTPPQLDRWNYRSAEDRDRPGARDQSRSVADELAASVETQELLVDRIDVAGPAGTEAVPSPGDGAATADKRTTSARDNTGREDATRTPHDVTPRRGDESQSRAPGEPTLDPDKVHRHLTAAERDPTPAVTPGDAQKTAAPKRIPEVKQPDPARARQRDGNRDTAHTTERDEHGRDDASDRDNARVAETPEPVVPPPPPPPEPEPDIDIGP